jgi:hypothetical protein
MKTKSKIWLGVGAFVVVGAGAALASGQRGNFLEVRAPDTRPERGSSARAVGTPAAQTTPEMSAPIGPATGPAVPGTSTGRFVIAQHAEHAPKVGEAGGEEGGEKGVANLPPELAFAARIALLRGHLLIGDELVKQQQWNAALPHFLHPGEEIYGDIKDQLADYKVPPFEASLKALAAAVKAKKGGNDYTKALKAVNDALAAADAGMKAKQSNWPSFVVEAAVEALKTAAGEYQAAIVGGRITKPVEYQDARGFVLQAERMIESVAPDLQKKDPAALGDVRTALAELRKAFPSPMPPRAPVKDHGAVLADVSRIELAAGKLM